ncbi:hypothetical protein BX600DRAFT_373960, partial [Xylariales sp. PMI_506]
LKTFRLGPGLHYPIRIAKIIKSKGDEVTKQESILQYTYKFKRTIGDPELGEEREIEETGYGDWDCPAEGTILQWHVKEGDTVSRDQVLIGIDEPCPHSEQIHGLCAMCGKDMMAGNWAADGFDTDRATIAMVHDDIALKVSATEAARLELQLQERLLGQRKLSLVVDLDQTIIHACIDPTVREWQSDPSNPNYEAVRDVRSFQLDDGPRSLDNSGCWYYIKLRPGLAGFLERMSKIFEMHVYTMGTRAYAQEIAKIVDPDMKIFANRIISRDENGSLTAKSLQRLFPVSTHMVVVIDDRADVWPNNRSNLIKVTPYDFFKGIGDINSSFLPKREDMIAPAPSTDPVQPNGGPSLTGTEIPYRANDASSDKVPPPMTNDENLLLQLQAEEQERSLEKQLKERPLLHLQEELDKEDAEAEAQGIENTPEVPEQNGHSESPPQQRHNLLRDDDQELFYLERHLGNLHRSFYDQYDARKAASREQGSVNDITQDIIPDVGKVLAWVKKRVLRGCSIVLSGLVPLGTDVERSEIGQHIVSFGGDLRTRINNKVTHLVINSSRPRTQKVRQAARIPTIRIVNQDWLIASLTQWEQLDEDPYLIEIHPADRALRIPGGEDGSAGTHSRPRIKLHTAVGQSQNLPVLAPANDEEDDEDEDGEDDSALEEDDEDDSDEEVADTYGVMPSDLDQGAQSPVEELQDLDWGNIEKEMAEFMGSDADTDTD